MSKPQEKSAEFLTIEEAAEYLGLHKNTIYKLARAGDLLGFKMTSGGSWRFEKDDLDQFILDQKYKRSNG